MRDLGLSYEAAGHGIQSAIRFEMSQLGLPDDGVDAPGAIARMLKHLRVGTDIRAAEQWALAQMLIAKGVITLEDYTEQMRLTVNEELARYQDHCRREYGLPDGTDFR